MTKSKIDVRTTLSTVALALLTASSALGADLRLHRYFTDDMVLQRDKPVIIKGWGTRGRDVSVRLGGQQKTCRADDDGAWRVTLDPMPADARGRALTVRSGRESVSLRNVIIGDVLIFARQSSIDVSLDKTSEGRRAAAQYRATPMLRTMKIAALPSKDPLEDLSEKATTGWTHVDMQSAPGMSAAAFHLGCDLVKALDVPLGLVDIHMGPHFGVAWLSDEALDESITRFPEQGDMPWYREHLPAKADAWASGETERKRDEYYAKQVEGAKRSQRPMPRKPSMGLSPLQMPQYPSVGYNAVIHPLRGVAVKAVLLQLGNDYPWVTYARLRAAGKITDRAELDRAWAQGYFIYKHGNRMTPYTLPLVPRDWRRTFGDDELPIGWIVPPGSDYYEYAFHNREVRELLRRTQKDETGIDLIMPGTENVPVSGQPADERLLAERCRHWVLGAVHGEGDVPSTGPVFECAEIGKGEVTISFKEGTARGLAVRGEALDRFEVAGVDKEFAPCAARIEGDTVKLKSDKVYYIASVRYNWERKPDQGLVNGAGLPALPFTTQSDWGYNWWPPAPPVELPAEYQKPANRWPERDIAVINGALNDARAGDSEPNPSLIGPTGMITDPFGPNLYVHRTEPGSPSDGKLLHGDLIYGVNGEEFGDDMYRQIANAITYSESEAGGGRLALGVRRKGKNVEVELQLDVLGSYSSTTPFYCPKSDRIGRNAEEWMANRYRPKAGLATEPRGKHDTDLLFLLASGNPEHQGLVRRVIQRIVNKPINKADPNKRAIPWHIGYGAILLGEYYNATGDSSVLPHLKNNADWAAVTQLHPQGEPGPWEKAYTEQQVGGYRTRYSPGRPMSTGGYGLMAAAGMPCVMGMLYAKEAGCEVDEVALQRGLKHFNYRRAEYGDVIYWYHPLWRDGPKMINPEAEAAGKLWSMNGKLGTAAALFNMVGYAKTKEICSRHCVYGFNNTRHGHGGMFYNNFWTPIGAHAAGERGFKHFMKGQTWWRELYRRHDGSFNQVGRGGVGVGYALHYVAPKKRLRMLGAPKSAFGTNPPEYLKAPLDAHRKRDYALCEDLIMKEIRESVLPAEDMPVVNQFLEAVRTLRASIEHDLTYAEQMIEQGRHYNASLELQQLKGVVAGDDPRLQSLVEALESPRGRAMIEASKKRAHAEDGELKRKQRGSPKPSRKEVWVCLTTEPGADEGGLPGKAPKEQPISWRMKVLETRAHAPDGWAEPGFDDSDWDETSLPISWRVGHVALFRGAFNVDDKKALDALRVSIVFVKQKNVEIHLNGKVVAKLNNISGSRITYPLTDYAMETLRNGENTLAVVTRHKDRWGKVKGDYCTILNGGGVDFRLDARKAE